jgi:hypothetical protein
MEKDKVSLSEELYLIDKQLMLISQEYKSKCECFEIKEA